MASQLIQSTALNPVLTGALLLYALQVIPPVPDAVLPGILRGRVSLGPEHVRWLTVLFGLGVARALSSFCGDGARNSWTTDETWDWKKEIVVVTGGSSGIGRLVAQDLARRGTTVVVLDIQEAPSALPENIYFYNTDVSSAAAIREVAEIIRARHGDPTVLINNAGIGHGGLILDTPETTLRRVFEVNTIAHFLLVQEFLPAMIRRDHGHVVTVASMASFVTIAANVDYSCSKASALAFHEGLAQELRHRYAAKRVRTSIVHPSWVRTPLTEPLIAAGKLRSGLLAPEAVADAIVAQLLSGKSGRIVLPGWASVFRASRALPSWLEEGIRNSAAHLVNFKP